MNILYIGYWGVHDGLTASTIIPHLKILSSFNEVDKITFTTIERSASATANINIDKVRHLPLVAPELKNVFLNKIHNFIFFPRQLVVICRNEKIDLIICRSSMAGALGYLVHKRTNIPYVVESYEPHAGYMLDSKTWSSFDPRYIIQKFFERKQKETARYLLPVTYNYESKLLFEGIAKNRIITMPCCVDIEQFRFDEDIRTTTRDRLKIPTGFVVGIYVGKYGDIYYDDEAFDLYKAAFDFFGDEFKLIILTSQSHHLIREKLISKGIPLDNVYLNCVPHDEVRDYLCAADFAFSTIRPSLHRIYCSPVKNGEYWANGLPILTEASIGDDTNIILNEGGGILLQSGKTEDAFVSLRRMLIKGRKRLALEIEAIARKHRTMEIVKQSYKSMLSNFFTKY